MEVASYKYAFEVHIFNVLLDAQTRLKRSNNIKDPYEKIPDIT